MKRMVDGLLVLAAVLAAAAWLPASATAQVAKEPPGFAFGRAPEFDCPPLPKDTAGKNKPWRHGGNDTGTVASQRDNAQGRVLRQLTEAVGLAKSASSRSAPPAGTRRSGSHWADPRSSENILPTKSIPRKSNSPARISKRLVSTT